MEKLGCTADEANKLINETDKYRADYDKYDSGGEDWTNPVIYDLTLNSARIGAKSA